MSVRGAGALRRVRASAPGKVNLVLEVGEPTEAGYHPLLSVFDTVGLREEILLTLRPAAAGETGPVGRLTHQVEATEGADATRRALADVPTERHLAARALRAVLEAGGSDLAKQVQAGELVVDLEVTKRIPVAGGMAGGSADAAAALVGANELLDAGLSEARLLEVGATLGADVPACLAGRVSVATRYGDQIRQRLDVPAHHWVLLLAHGGLSTPEVFRAFDAEQRGRADLSEALDAERTAALRAGDLAPLLTNDLEAVAAALRTDIRTTLERARGRGWATLLSGSGPTVAVLVADTAAAEEIAAEASQWPSVAAALITTAPGEPAHATRVTTAPGDPAHAARVTTAPGEDVRPAGVAGAAPITPVPSTEPRAED